MKDLLQKAKDFYQKLRTKTVSYKKSGIRPEHDWKVMLVTTFVSLCLLAICAFYFYIQVDSGQLFVVAKVKTEKEVKLDAVLLKKTIDDINLRADSLQTIKQNKTVPIEPSS